MLTFEDLYSLLKYYVKTKKIELCLRNVEPCMYFSVKNLEGVF